MSPCSALLTFSFPEESALNTRCKKKKKRRVIIASVTFASAVSVLDVRRGLFLWSVASVLWALLYKHLSVSLVSLPLFMSFSLRPPLWCLHGCVLGRKNGGALGKWDCRSAVLDARPLAV